MLKSHTLVEGCARYLASSNMKSGEKNKCFKAASFKLLGIIQSKGGDFEASRK